MYAHAPLTVRTAVLFFAPLILTTELHQLSHSLVWIFPNQVRNLTTALCVMLQFAHRLALVYAVLVVSLFYTPMRDVILSGIMGLPAKLSSYAAPGVQMLLLVVIVWGYSSLFRGLLSAMRKTRAIAGSAVIRLLVVIAVGSVTFIAPHLNGAAVGVAAVGAAFLAEVLILGRRVTRYSRTTGPIFPRET